MDVERSEVTDASTDDKYVSELDFVNDTYTLTINDALFETRPLTDAERKLDTETNIPEIEQSDIERELRKLREQVKQLVLWMRDNTPLTQQDIQAIQAAADAALAKKRA